MDTIDILQGSFGCTGCTSHYDIDPYWNMEGGFHENARGDGGSYCGVVGVVTRVDGESDHDFEQRASIEAIRLAGTDGMYEQCRQYRE